MELSELNTATDYMRKRSLYLIVLMLVPVSGPAFGRDALWETNLTEHLGRPWTGELLHYRFNTAAPLPRACRLSVTDETGKSRDAAVQIDRAAGEQPDGQNAYDLYCVADLAPYGNIKIQLFKGRAGAGLADPLPFKTNGKTITASSGALEIQVPDSITDGRGLSEVQVPSPLLRIRNSRQDGWGGAGVFTNVGELQELKTAVTARGPVFMDIALEYRFSQGSYLVSLRLIRDQPLVLWRDETRHDNPAAMLTWNFTPGFSPKAVFPCLGKDSQGRPTRTAQPVKTIVAWGVGLQPGSPWMELHPSTSFAARVGMTQPPVEKTDGDAGHSAEPTASGWVIGLFSGFPRDWKIVESQHPVVPFWYSLPLVKPTPATNVLFELPLFGGKRAFGFSVDDRADGTAIRSIQYGQTPLDEVKEFVLDYDGDMQDTFPHRLFDEAARRECAAALNTNSPFYAGIRKAQDSCAVALASQKFSEVTDWLNAWELDTAQIWGPWQDSELIKAALYSRDDALAPLLRAGAMASARKFTRHFFEPVQSDRTWLSTWFSGEHGLSVVDSGSRYLEPEQFRRVRARVLFLAYKMASEMFEYSRTGRGAPLNMCRTHINGFLGTIAVLYPHHPKAREWIETAKKEMVYELTELSGPNGGWVEAPHYMTVSMDYLVAFALGLARAGEDDLLYHERLKQTVRWLARISTPRDARYGNRRHFPEIGNTYRNEGSVLFSLMARAWRQRDPIYADEMQWIWNEMGCPMWFHIGGVVPLTEGYREALVDRAPPPDSPPAWKSEWFVDSGVVLRSHFGTDRENYLYLIQGNLHEHYDKDNGSFILWGKGRPLCEDWGYNCGPGGPISEHNRMDIGGEGRVTEFAALGSADYVHSRQGPWDRQILFVKDADPLGPSYYLLRDSTAVSGTNTWGAGVTPFRLWPTSPYVAGTGTNEWRLWINVDTNSCLPAAGRLVTATGRDDVDLDIWFDDASLQLLRKVRQPAEDGKSESDLPWLYDAQRKTVWVITGDNKGYWGSTGLEQRELLMRVPRGQNVVAMLYPRLRGERKPEVRSFADDRALEIVSPQGTDYVFLSLDRMEEKARGIRFSGTAGVLQRRAAGQVLSLAAAGEIVDGKFGLSAEWPVSLRAGGDVLEIELAADFPGGQIVITAPSGYVLEKAAEGVILGNREGGRYMLNLPAGKTHVSLKK